MDWNSAWLPRVVLMSVVLGVQACSHGDTSKTPSFQKPDSSGAISATAAASEQTNAESPIPELPWRTETITIGDTTVVRTVGANDAEATMMLVREVAMGTRDGRAEETFKNVEYVTPLPDGGVIFFDYGAYSARRFDSAGVYLNSLGGPGVGPGEFRSASRIDLVPGDQVLIAGSGKFHLFETGGRFIRSWSMLVPGEFEALSLRTVTTDGYLHVGNIVADPRFPDSLTSSGGRPYTQTAHRVLLEKASNPQSTAAPMADTTLLPLVRVRQPRFEYQLRGAKSLSPIPLRPVYQSTYSTLGYWITGGDDGKYSITLHRRLGGPLRIESDVEAIPATDSERATLLYAWQYNLRRFDPSAEPTLALIPKQKSPFKEITTDAQGRIWVQITRAASKVALDTMPVTSGAEAVGGGRGAAPAPPVSPSMRKPTEAWVEPLVYDVFATDGEFLGRVALPARAKFGNAMRDKVWLVVHDELDVPTVVRFRVTGITQGETGKRWM